MRQDFDLRNHKDMKVIEEYRRNNFELLVFLEPNGNGKTYLDQYHGLAIDHHTNQITCFLNAKDLDDAKRKLILFTKLCRGDSLTDVYIPMFNKPKGGAE